MADYDEDEYDEYISDVDFAERWVKLWDALPKLPLSSGVTEVSAPFSADKGYYIDGGEKHKFIKQLEVYEIDIYKAPRENWYTYFIYIRDGKLARAINTYLYTIKVSDEPYYMLDALYFETESGVATYSRNVYCKSGRPNNITCGMPDAYVYELFADNMELIDPSSNYIAFNP